MQRLILIKNKLQIVDDPEPLTRVDEFKMKNDLSDAEFSYLMLRKRLGQRTLGNIPMPNGDIKNVVEV